MKAAAFVALLCIGMLLCVLVAYLSFVDYIGVCVKIFPSIQPKDYAEYNTLIKSTAYKKHKRKWRGRFSLSALIYTLIYVLLSVVMHNTVYGFLLGLWGAAISIGVMEYFANKEKKNIQK